MAVNLADQTAAEAAEDIDLANDEISVTHRQAGDDTCLFFFFTFQM